MLLSLSSATCKKAVHTVPTVFLSSALGSFKSTTFGPVARRNRTGIGTRCPLPDHANFHPLRSNLQDSVWPGPTLTGALLLRYLRDTTVHGHGHEHSYYPSYTFEKRPAFWHRLSCRYQLHLSPIPVITDTWRLHTSVSIFSQNKVIGKPQEDDTRKRRS